MPTFLEATSEVFPVHEVMEALGAFLGCDIEEV